jgi:CRP/FNR family cyclic AMP-dependent transcriptional regulator
MDSNNTNTGYFVWGLDKAAYGPVELPALIAWIKDERVFADTWLFAEQGSRWQQAAALPELQLLFRPPSASAAGTGAPQGASLEDNGVKPGALRRVKILAGFTDQELARFAQCMVVEKVRQWTQVVKQGDHSDAMYLILEGELRVRIMVADKEKILVTLGPGEFFGDIALFDHGPRSADVVANKDSLVLKLTAAAFQKFARECPEIATPFLLAVGKTLTARIRADNKRYQDTIYFRSAASD